MLLAHEARSIGSSSPSGFRFIMAPMSMSETDTAISPGPVEAVKRRPFAVSLKSILSPLADLLLPPVCIVCRARIGRHGLICGACFGKIDFIASKPTSQLMSDLAQRRFQATLDEVPKQIDQMRMRAGKSSLAAEKAFCEEQVRQMQAYQSEMKNFTLELPTITFEKTYVIKDGGEELHLEFHGRAHTAGDVVVFCPAKRAIATGDMIHGALPYMADGFPMSWPKTIDSVARLGFDKICPGHGSVQQNRLLMTSMRNYIEELTEKVEAGKKAGKSIADLEKTITVASLKSMQSNGYSQFLSDNAFKHSPHFGPARSLQSGVNANIADVYNNLERM